MVRTSKQWLKVFGIKREWIHDPDGWDRRNFDYSFNRERITAVEFEKRLMYSTIYFGKEGINFPLTDSHLCTRVLKWFKSKKKRKQMDVYERAFWFTVKAMLYIGGLMALVMYLCFWFDRFLNWCL